MIQSGIRMPERAILQAANVNHDTGLATDYLSVFNEYIMLATWLPPFITKPFADNDIGAYTGGNRRSV